VVTVHSFVTWRSNWRAGEQKTRWTFVVFQKKDKKCCFKLWRKEKRKEKGGRKKKKRRGERTTLPHGVKGGGPTLTNEMHKRGGSSLSVGGKRSQRVRIPLKGNIAREKKKFKPPETTPGEWGEKTMDPWGGTLKPSPSKKALWRVVGP